MEQAESHVSMAQFFQQPGGGDTSAQFGGVAVNRDHSQLRMIDLVHGNGCIVQVTTQQRNPDGSYAVAEALSYVLGVFIISDKNNGRKLVTSKKTN